MPEPDPDLAGRVVTEFVNDLIRDHAAVQGQIFSVMLSRLRQEL